MQNTEILELIKQLQSRDKTIADFEYKTQKLELHNQQLQLQLEQLKRLIFGKKSEKNKAQDNPLQATLFELPQIETITQTKEIPAHTVSKTIATNEKNKSSRNPLPAHLERKEFIITPENIPAGSVIIGEEITEILEIENPKFYVNKIIRPKYKVPSSNNILIGKLPERIINKGVLGDSIVADMIIKKYVDHIPVYRQQKGYKRIGIDIEYNTMLENMQFYGKSLTPLYYCLMKLVMKSWYVQNDETSFKVIDESKKGKIHLGYMWVTHSPPNNLILFTYNKSRSTEAANSILKDFKGYLQTDAYSAYGNLKNADDIIHMYCMAHVRRKFFDAKKNNASLANYALDLIRNLYAIEETLREEKYSDEQMLEIRQTKSIPLLNQFKEWLKENLLKVTPKSPIGVAIGYALKCYDGLIIYTQHAKLQIDNNQIENKIRPVALGRKNYMFSGSHNAAQISAIYYSLVGSCILNNVNPNTYFEKLFKIIPNEKVNNLEYLLPNSDFWKK